MPKVFYGPIASANKLLKNPKVEVFFEHEPRSFKKKGDKMIVEVENLKTKAHKDIESDGAFIFVGFQANLGDFGDKLEKDEWGYVKTDEDKRTSIDGVFAVGDISSKKYRQITTAVADGTIAAISITKEIDK